VQQLQEKQPKLGIECTGISRDIKSLEWNWKYEGLMIEDAVSRPDSADSAEQRRLQQQLAVPAAPVELVGLGLDAAVEESGST
jgi:hypothetical protein